MTNVQGIQLIYKFSIRSDIELRFMLKKLQKQLQSEYSPIHLVKLPEKFPFTFDDDDQIQGKKAGVKQEEVYTQHFLHT